MAHKLIRFKEQYLNKPHLISQESFDSLFDYVNKRNDEEVFNMAIAADKIAAKQGKRDLVETDVAILSVNGALTYQPTLFQALCGGTSYQSLMEDFDSVVMDRKVNTIVLDVDSGGGEAYGMAETASYMKEKAKEYDKRFIAYVDGISASAAYGLSTATDEIIVNPMAEVGSIGVVVKLMNQNKKLEKEGIEQTYVCAGASKVPFNAEGEFRKDFIEDLQQRVDTLYEDFTGMVAANRNISQDTVKNTEAAMFSAKEAVELGLADKVMTREEFYNYLADLSEGKEMPLLKKTKEETQMSKDNIVENQGSIDTTELTAKLEEQSAQLTEMADFVAKLKSEKEALEKLAHENVLKELHTKLSGYSFIGDDVSQLVELADQMDDKAQALLFGTLDKAAAAIESSVQEEMVVEGEAEVELSTGDKEKEKAATASAIKAKYTVSN